MKVYLNADGERFIESGVVDFPRKGDYYLGSGAHVIQASTDYRNVAEPGARKYPILKRDPADLLPGAHPPGTVLDEARRRVDGEQGERYGPPSLYFEKCATLFSVLLGVEVTPEQVVQLDIAKKLARLSEKPGHHDSLVDIAGYARVAELLEQSG